METKRSRNRTTVERRKGRIGRKKKQAVEKEEEYNPYNSEKRKGEIGGKKENEEEWKQYYGERRQERLESEDKHWRAKREKNKTSRR